MKGFLTILISCIISAFSFGQAWSDQTFKMTRQDNNQWINETKSARPELQLEWIKQRLIINRNELDSLDSNISETPVFVIDGIFMDDTISTELKNFVLEELTVKNVEILVFSESDLHSDRLFCRSRSLVLISILDDEKKLKFEKIKKNTNAQQ